MQAVMVLADAEYPQVCAFRGVTEYIAAAPAIGWDLTAGYSFPMVELNSERRITAITTSRMTAAIAGASTSRGDARPFHDALV